MDKKESLIAIIVIAIAILSLSNGSITGFATIQIDWTGGGTKADPYQISNCIELQNMTENLSSHFILVNNINCSDTTNWNPTGPYTGFIPIGDSENNFEGNFNGQNYTINKLHINRPNQNYRSLLGYSYYGNVSDVGLLDINITGNRRVGAIIGTMEGGKITNSHSTGNLSADSGYVGGLVGHIESNASILNSYAIVDVYSDGSYSGGLVGRNDFGLINNSHANGSVNSTSNYAGGLAGLHGRDDFSIIDNSYASGEVYSEGDYVGGLVGASGDSEGPYGAIINSYAKGTVTGGEESRYIGGLVGQLRSSNISNSYAIGNVSSNDGYVGGLVGGIQFNAKILNSYAIVDVYSDGSYAGGLVGRNNRGLINNSHANGSVNSTSNYAGGLIGYHGRNFFSIIDNSYATGNVFSESNYVGGLVGYSSDSGGPYGDIYNSYATGNVTGESGYVGGLAGVLGVGNITNSYATGNVNGSDSYVGGLVGASSYDDDTVISNSYATGNVFGDSDSVGGLVGEVGDSGSGQVIDSYATGNVRGGIYTGGLVGRYLDGDINNSYATGNVKGPYGIGGLVGTYSGGTLSESYATGNVNGSGGYVGGLIGISGYDDDLIINKTYATGNVYGGDDYVGGLIGYNGYDYDALIVNSYASGNVTGDSSYIGGLIGLLDGSSLRYSFATGNVNGTYTEGEGIYIGGLVGENNVPIRKSFATGKIYSDDDAYGIVGSKDADVTRTFWFDNENDDADACGAGPYGPYGEEEDPSPYGCLKINESTGINYFFSISNSPLSLWTFPPWDNFCNGVGYPSLEFENLTNTSNCLAFTPDTVPPTVTIDSPEEDDTETSGNLATELSGSFSETASTATYTVDNLGENVAICSECSSFEINATFTSYGEHTITVSATDASGNTGNANVTFDLKLDTDGDGTPDDEDDDDDNDGIDDEDDFLTGDSDNINSNFNINFTVNGSSDLSQLFNTTLPIKFKNGSETIVEFDFTFSNTTTLNLANITIKETSNATTGSIIIAGINLTGIGQTKTVYFTRVNQNINGICIKDTTIASIAQVTTACNSAGEVKIECDGSAQSEYTCTYNSTSNKYKVTGLSHSGVTQIPFTQPIAETLPSGGGSSVKTINIENNPQLTSREGERILFTYLEESHRLKINSIDKNSISLTIRSSLITVKLLIGETKLVDLNRDGINDISITLKNIFENKATIKLEIIQQVVEASLPIIQPVIETPEPIKEIIPEPKESIIEEPVPAESIDLSPELIWLSVIIIFIGLITLIALNKVHTVISHEKRLHKYVKKAKRQGHSIDKIRKELSKIGWPKHCLDKVFRKK